MELHVAGDFVDLHGFLLKRLDHNVGAMTPVRMAMVPHDALRGITETHPHLGRMLWFSTLLDAAIHREKILSIGRRSAMARIAHIFCELLVRLRIVGLADETGYRPAAHPGRPRRRDRPHLGPRQPDAQEAARRRICSPSAAAGWRSATGSGCSGSPSSTRPTSISSAGRASEPARHPGEGRDLHGSEGIRASLRRRRGSRPSPG